MGKVIIQPLSLGRKSKYQVGVKDNMDIVGYVTQAGSLAMDDNLPAYQNAYVVDRVIAADCKVIGKLNMHELAFGMTGVNDNHGTPLNYHFPDYIPGGSSSGCAVAVAEGLVDFSLGTDTGGSIRVPAACCGVYGIKPTFGRINNAGVIPQESSLDCIGIMASSMKVLTEAMQMIDPGFIPMSATPISPSPTKPLRLGWVDVDAQALILTLHKQALNNDNIVLEHKALPSLQAAFDAALKLMNFEMWQAFNSLVPEKLGADVAKRLQAASKIPASILSEASAVKAQFIQEVDNALQDVDALVLPTLPALPLTREQALAGQADLSVSLFTRPFNLSGHPAITLPLGNHAGVPVGMQLIGERGKDEALCAVASALASANDDVVIPVQELKTSGGKDYV